MLKVYTARARFQWLYRDAFIHMPSMPTATRLGSGYNESIIVIVRSHMHSIPLLVIAGSSVILGAVALLSSWGLLAPEIWWQALLSLGVIMVTMWTAVGALKYLNKESDAHWFPREAVWALVGIVVIYVIVVATYVAPVADDTSLYYDLDTLLPPETEVL